MRECVRRLDANSPAVRESAEKALIAMGPDVLPALVALLKEVRSRTAKSGLERVLLGWGRDRVVAGLTRLREDLKGSDAKRVDALLTSLGGALTSGSTTGFDLTPSRALDWELVPFGAEHVLEDSLPAAWSLQRYAVQTSPAGLRLDADGDGRLETTLAPEEARVVEAGVRGATRPILIYPKLHVWYACSARLLEGEVQGAAIQLLDADLDGRFDGVNDYVRWRGGAFIRQRPERRLATERGPASFDVTVEGDAGASVALRLLEETDRPTGDQARALARLNEFRNRHGLAPQRFGADRSKACGLHASYLAKYASRGPAVTEGGATHTEDPSLPGYTSEGATAASESVISSGGLVPAIDLVACTMLHRIHWLGPAEERAGLGSAQRGRHGWSVLWTGRGSSTDTGTPVPVPAPGARDVPRRGAGEWPPPDDIEGYYQGRRGYPISVTYAPLVYEDVRLRLLRSDGVTPVRGQLFTPERPIARSHAGNAGTAFLMPQEPLDPKTRYWAVFTARERGRAVRHVWTFQTQ